MPKKLTLPRRQLLKGLGAGAATGLIGCEAEPDLQSKPVGTTPADVDPGQIDTIVICMMENRSFDHVFGGYTLEEGRTDIDGPWPGLSNPNLDGEPVPMELDRWRCIEPDPPHGWSTSRTQFADGACDGFVRALQESRGAHHDGLVAMCYQNRAQQPVTYALADRYALCQRWFSSVLSSTWPNRLYFHCAQSEGRTNNTLPEGGRYTARTIWHQLTDAGIDWGYYFTDLPTLALWADAELAEHFGTMDDFYADAAAGALPRVCCVDPGAAFNDDHPPHHPLLGQLYLGSVYQALADSPHWERSLFVLTYDEAGGFHDHVPPGTVPDDYAAEGFDQLGFRVPGLVMGPWVRPQVSDTLFEHSAALTFIQDWFGIDERLTARNAASNDLTELLDLAAMGSNLPSAPIRLPPIQLSEEEIDAQCAMLGGRTGQPELRGVVRQHSPWLDRTADMPGIARSFFRKTAEQGLWVPA